MTQDRLAKLVHLSRETVQRLEAGSIRDLGFQRVTRLLSILGLSFGSPSLEQRASRRGLWMAAISASVSYKGELSPDMLEHTLATGQAPVGFEPHIGHFLDEVPVEVVVMAVEETAQREAVPPVTIWKHVSILAAAFATTRQDLWI